MGDYASACYGASLYGDQLEHPYGKQTNKLMWMAQIDWADDGDFGSTIEPQSIRSMRFFRGRKSRLNANGSALAQPDDENFSITLNDPGHRYDPFNLQSPLFRLLGRPFVRMRILVVSTTSRQAAMPVFHGSLTEINFDLANNLATLSGEGLAALWRQPANPPSQPFSASGWDPIFVPNSQGPFPINYWKQRPGGLSLQQCAGIVAQHSGWKGGLEFGSVSESATQPEYFILRGKSGWQSMKDLAAGFLANLFFLRRGNLFVMDASDTLGLHAALPAPGAALQRHGLQRNSPFASLRNQVEVKLNPFSVPPFTQPTPAASYKTGWYAAGPIKLDPGQQLDLDVTFSEGYGRCFQGNFARVPSDSPLETYPMRVNSQADGNGVNMGVASGNGEGEFSLLNRVVGENGNGIIYAQYYDDAARCRVRLKNWSSTRSAYFFDLRVLVIGFSRAGDALSIGFQDDDSIALNGQRNLTIDSDLIQSAENAQVIAGYALKALANRQRAGVSGLAFSWQGQALYLALERYELGSHIDFGADGQESFGLVGRHLLVGLELELHNADCQAGLVTLWLQKALPLPVTTSGITTQTGSGSAILAWQHSVSDSGSVLVVQVTMRSYGQVSTVSFAGQSLSRIGFVALGYPTNGNFPRVEMWALTNPPCGSATVSVTLSQADYIQAAALNLYGADTGQPFGEVLTSKALSGVVNLSAPLRAGDLLIGCVANEGTSDSANTLLWSASSDGNWRGSGASQDGEGEVCLDWEAIHGGHAAMGVVVRAKYP